MPYFPWMDQGINFFLKEQWFIFFIFQEINCSLRDMGFVFVCSVFSRNGSIWTDIIFRCLSGTEKTTFRLFLKTGHTHDNCGLKRLGLSTGLLNCFWPLSFNIRLHCRVSHTSILKIYTELKHAEFLPIIPNSHMLKFIYFLYKLELFPHRQRINYQLLLWFNIYSKFYCSGKGLFCTSFCNYSQFF